MAGLLFAEPEISIPPFNPLSSQAVLQSRSVVCRDDRGQVLAFGFESAVDGVGAFELGEQLIDAFAALVEGDFQSFYCDRFQSQFALFALSNRICRSWTFLSRSLMECCFHGMVQASAVIMLTPAPRSLHRTSM